MIFAAWVVGSCEHGNGPSGSIKGSQFIALLSNYQLLKKAFASWSWTPKI
jgi:hypothetical protein